MGRVSAVDHVVCRGLPVAPSTSSIASRERLTVGHRAVGFNGEGNNHRHAGGLRRARDADRLLRISHGYRRDHVRVRVAKDLSLRRWYSCASGSFMKYAGL